MSVLVYFNSIKVRLEHNDLKDSVFDLSVFQFHKGTIRTFRNLEKIVHYIISIP